MKSEIATDIAYVNTFAFAPFPSRNPQAVLDSIPERVRVLPEMEFAYLRGDFALVKSLFQNVWEGEDEALKLSATTVAISAAIGSGDYPLYLEIETWLKEKIKENISKGANTIAQWTLGASYIGAQAPGMAPRWLQTGDYKNSPPLTMAMADKRPCSILAGSHPLCHRWTK